MQQLQATLAYNSSSNSSSSKTLMTAAVSRLLMWISLSMVFGPISVALDVIPFLGELSRTLIGVVTFIAALVLSLVTIVISNVIHHPLLLLALALIVAVVVLVGFVRQRRTAAIALSAA